MRKSKNCSGFALMELLLVVLLFAMFASMVCPALIKAHKKSRAIIKKTEMFHNARIEVFLRDDASETTQMWHATNTAKTFAPDHYVLPKHLVD